MAILLVFDRDNVHADPEKDYRGSYKKGYIVETFDDSKPYVNPPAEPFLILQVTDRTQAQIINYQNQWMRVVDYSVINRDVPLDGWRLEIKTTNANPSGKGHLTQAMVESYLNRWNASVVGFVANGVRFDISVYLAATSQAFWGRDVSLVSFSELAYDEGTGVHQIQADYNAVPFPPNTSLSDFEAMFSRAVESHGGTVVSNAGGVIVFDLPRDQVIQTFRDDVKFALQRIAVCKRDAYLDPAFVDQIIANGRVMVTDAATVAPWIRSRATE